MAVSGVGATPEPQRNLSQNVNEQDEKLYSILIMIRTEPYQPKNKRGFFKQLK